METATNYRGYGTVTIRHNTSSEHSNPTSATTSAADEIAETPSQSAKDPTPDFAIEVEVSSSVLNRLSIYAVLGVLEVWRYDGEKIPFCCSTNMARTWNQRPVPCFPLPMADFADFVMSWRPKHALPSRSRGNGLREPVVTSAGNSSPRD